MSKQIPAKLMRPGQIGIVSSPSSHQHIGKTVVVIGNDLCISGGAETDRWRNYQTLVEDFMVTLVEPTSPIHKPIEIKVRGCNGCPFWQWAKWDSQCNHPRNTYGGEKPEGWIEHCPLKERDTVIKFERDEK